MEHLDGSLLIAPGIRFPAHLADEFLARPFDTASSWSLYQRELYELNCNQEEKFWHWYFLLNDQGLWRLFCGEISIPVFTGQTFSTR